LQREYQRTRHVLLSIDGLQPEKGHETLYVVRELNRQRVWFAESLISSAAGEVRPLFAQARQWAERLGKPVRLWTSAKQDAFVTGIAAEFPHVPHRYCRNPFLRALAQPVLALDRHAKVRLWRRVRGLRAIERAVLAQRRSVPNAQPPSSPPLSGVGFLSSQTHLMSSSQCVIVNRLGPRLRDKAAVREVTLIEQRHQDGEPALAKDTDQA
jgi:hypothetical protein